MKKTIAILLTLLLLAYFMIVKQTTIGASEEGIMIKRPWFMGEKGLSLTPETTGSIWHVSSTEVKIISLKAFTLKEELFEVLTLDNIPIDFDMHFTFQYIAGKTPLLIQKFGDKNEWYNAIVREPLVNSIENFVKNKDFNEMLNDVKTKQELESSILFGVQDLLKRSGIPVALLRVNVNGILPPQKIIDEAIKTEVVKEEIQRKKEEKNLELIREATEKARAKADKSYMATMGMNVREYLEMKRIELKEKQVLNQKFAIEQAKDSNGSINLHLNIER